MAPTRCACGESVGNHNCISALKAKVAHQRRLLESADELAKWANGVQQRLLDALHSHHMNDLSPFDCAACRSVVMER